MEENYKLWYFVYSLLQKDHKNLYKSYLPTYLYIYIYIYIYIDVLVQFDSVEYSIHICACEYIFDAVL